MSDASIVISPHVNEDGGGTSIQAVFGPDQQPGSVCYGKEGKLYVVTCRASQ
jgi:hypothetical protein